MNFKVASSAQLTAITRPGAQTLLCGGLLSLPLPRHLGGVKKKETGKSTAKRKLPIARKADGTAEPETTVPAVVDESTRVPSVPVVGVGASAGGLEAFTQLLTHLTPDTGFAFVLVQHLDPRHASILPAGTRGSRGGRSETERGACPSGRSKHCGLRWGTVAESAFGERWTAPPR